MMRLHSSLVPGLRRSAALAVVVSGLVSGVSMSACAPLPDEEPAPELERFTAGTDQGRGNLLGVQTWLTAADFATVERYRARLGRWLEDADADGLLGEQTVVVFPEYVGSWLVVLDEPGEVITASDTTSAMIPLALRQGSHFAGLAAGAPADDATSYAAFASKARRMATAYQDVMSDLAERFGVTVVGGSILLPGPAVREGSIVVEPGAPLYNTSFVFGPDGQLLGPPVKKVFPTADELSFVTPGLAEELPVFDTPAGRLGVLVCADAWYPATYAALAEQAPDLIAVPQWTTGEGYWSEPWGGYSGHDAPDDVDEADIGVLTEGEAWERYALPGRLGSTSARAGLTVPFRGKVWDLGSDGHALLREDETTFPAPLVDAPALLNLWL